MYYIEKTMEISACHNLKLDYESKCTNMHGHNWQITIFCKREKLDENGMVCDFSCIKNKIHGFLDHHNLNEVLDFNPTAENIARWCTEQIPECWKAVVRETEGNTASYIADDSCTNQSADLRGFLRFLHRKGVLSDTCEDEKIVEDYFYETEGK